MLSMQQDSSSSMLVYKFVELNVVTDDSIETVVNERVAQGWQFDGMHFAMTVGSRRPGMAFLAFVKEQPDVPDTEEPDSED